MSSDESYNIDDDSISQCTNEPDLNTWRGWKKPVSYYDKKVPLFHTWSAYQNLSSNNSTRTPRPGMSYNNNTFPSISYPNNVSIYTSHNGDILYDFTTTPTPTSASNEQHTEITKKNRIESLTELTVRVVASHIPFECVERLYPPVPEPLQMRIAYWSFPQNEDEIRLYACLTNGSGDEFSRGENLFKNKIITEAIQIGFHLSTTITLSTSTKSQRYNVAVSFDRGKITSCTCNCLLPSTHNATSSLYMHQPYFTLGISNINLNNNSSITPTSTMIPINHNYSNNINTAHYVNNSILVPGSGWCCHVVALCLFRIYNPQGVTYRAPVSESLSKLHRDQLQKFAQYLISELPQQILPTAQRILDELLVGSRLNELSGAPDPTAGGSTQETPHWFLDESLLHDNIRKTLYKLCIPTPIVFSDVNYLSATAPPAALEWSNLMRPLRGREPEGMWNLLNIVKETLKKRDKNAIRLLKIITEEVLNSDRVITYWYNTKVAEMHGKNILNRNSSTNITVSTQHACLNLCDEIVNLWCICMMNPEASNIERQILCDYLKSQHVILMDKIICMGKPHTHHFNVQAQIPQSIPSSDNQSSHQIPHQGNTSNVYPAVNNNQNNNNQQNNHNTPAYTHSTSASSSNNFPLRKWDLENFLGFKPAIRAFSIALHDTPMCYNHSTINENIIENESNYLDTQHKDLKIFEDQNESVVENTYDGSLTLIETMTLNDKSSVSPSDVIEKKTKCELEIPFVAPSTLLANAEQNIETYSESERVSNNNNNTLAHINSQTTTLVNNNNPNLDYFAHLEPITESENLFYRAQGLYYHGFYTKALPIIYKLAHILLTAKQGTRFDNEQTFFQVGTKGVLGKKIHYQVTKDCLYQFYQTIFLCTVLIEAAEMRITCLDATTQNSNEFDSSVASNETLVEGKNQVFNDIQTHYLLALRLGVNALAHLRPPASSKALEVKLANQESVLWELLSRIAPAFPHLILPHVRRYSLDFVSNAITFNRCNAGKDVCTCNFYSSAHLSNEMFENDSLFTLNKDDNNGNKITQVAEGHYNRHQTILPHTLATLLFEMLSTYTKEYGHKTMLSSTVVKHCNTKSILTANHDCQDKTNANSTLTKLCESRLPQNNDDDEIIEENLEFRMGLMALELRTAISESDYPLLIEGMRRRRGELALLLITAHKNDCHKLALIMDRFLDPCFHIMCQRPLSCAYFSTARYNTDILTDKAILQHTCSECIELCSFTSDLTITPDESRELTTPKKVLIKQCPDVDDMDKPSTSSNFKSTFKDDSQTKNISIKADNYTSRLLSYDSLVPTEAGAHYAFEFAKTLLIKAGGNVNSDLFLHQNNTSSHYYTQTNHRNQTHTTTTTNNNNHRDGLTRSYNINDGTRNHHNSGSSGESPSDSISNEAGGGMYGHLSYSAFCMRNSYYANLNNFNNTNNNNTSFNATPIPNNHHGPHKALHFAAFQIGLYALGLHNRCSPNWHSRTYSSHVSWITGQALEIGTSALTFLLSPIIFSLTHQQKNENSMDSTTVTLKKSNANNICKLHANQNVGNLMPLSNSNNNNNTNYYGGTHAKKYLPEIPALDDDEREVGEFNACLTWHLHLTPSEAASLADKAASSSNIHRDPQLLNKASQLALSCLAKCHALSITETQRALIQCKEQSSSLLKQGCRYVEREARCNYVAPEILFEVARLWYGLFTTTFNNASISSNKIHANHNNTNNNNIALKQPNKVEQNSNVKNLSTTNMVTNSSSNLVNISLPTNVGTSPIILTPNQSMLRSGTYGVSNDTEWPIEQTSITNNFNNTNHHTFNQNIANHLVQTPSSMATTFNHTPQLTLTSLNNLNHINVNQFTSNITNNLNIVYNIQPNFAGGLPYNQLQPHIINNINNQTVPPPLPIIPALHNNNHHQHQFQTFYNNSVVNNGFPPPVLAPNFIFNNHNNSCNINDDNRPQFSLPPQIIPHIYPALIPPPPLPPLPPTYLPNPNSSLILPLVRPQLPVVSNASIVHIPTPAATINHLGSPTSINAQKNNIHPYTTISQKTNNIAENSPKPKSNSKYIAEDITSEDSIEKPNININSSITKISGYDHLESAFRVGMMALELLGKKILDERSQTKYAPNPTYGEDVKWLSQISLLLGLPFFQQFCSAVHACIASPFILQHIMFDAVDFMRNGFDLYRLLPPPLPSTFPTNTTSSINNQNSTNSINNNQVNTSSTTLYEMNNENVCSTIISQNSGIISLNKSCNNNQALTDQDMAHRVANFEAGVLGPLKTKCLQMYSNWVSMRVSHITPEEYDDFVQLLIHAKAAFTLSLPSVDRICTNKNTLIANNSSSIPITPQDNTLSKTGTCKSNKISNEGFTNNAGTFKHLVKLQPPSGANNKRNNKQYGQNTIGNKSLSTNANINKNNYLNNNNNTIASTTTKTYNNNFNNLSPHPPPSIQYVGNNSELNRFHDFLHSIKNTKSFRKELWIKILQNVINYTPAQTENTNYMVPSFNNTTNNALPSIVSSQHPQLPLLPFYIDQPSHLQNMSIQYSHNP